MKQAGENVENRVRGIKKILCNPPANRVAESGDPEVLGMFEGAGQAIAHAIELDYEGEHREAIESLEQVVVTLEAEYVGGRKALAASMVRRMHSAFNQFVKEIGSEVYEGG